MGKSSTARIENSRLSGKMIKREDKMKISSIKNASNVSFVKRLKNMFSNCKLKLKTLTKDVFERQKRKYVIIDGKKYRARDLSNCEAKPNDYYGVVADEIKFYPEDEAVLKTMKDAGERIEYQSKLIKAGKFIE